MRILYGVVGEGMGHATRSRVVLEHLLTRGHQLRVVVSGRAHRFLQRSFADRPGFSIEEIEGLTLAYEGNRLTLGESLLTALERAPESLLKNIAAYARFAVEGYRPECVVSDFESWAYLYGLGAGVPVVSIDNMQVLNRCAHEADATDERSSAFQLAKAAVKIKLPGAYHYLVTSFFFPPVRKGRTTLVPPILRPEILSARREAGQHVLVYQTSTANTALLDILKRLPGAFRVYGMGREGAEANLTLCPFSQQGFVDDLRTARAVIAGGGFSLMSESVHLGVPMLSVPIEGQYEQELNARYLAKLGYGERAEDLDADTIARFLERLPEHQRALDSYPRQDNELLFACLDELLTEAATGRPGPVRLHTRAMGTYKEEDR